MVGQILMEVKLNPIKYQNLTIIFCSDHGMADLSTGNVLNLSNHFNETEMEILKPIYDEFLTGGFIRCNESAEIYNCDHFYNKLKPLTDTSSFQIFKKDQIPNQWFYKNNVRIAPLLLTIDTPNSIRLESGLVSSLGNHGYWREDEDMRAIFIAAGNGLKQGEEVDSFNSIDMYEMMCDILGIEGNANNGTKMGSEDMWGDDEFDWGKVKIDDEKFKIISVVREYLGKLMGIF